MCIPSPPKATTIPERQALQLPDGGSTAGKVEDDVRRRRALMATAYTGQLGVTGTPSTTNTLGA